MILPMLRTATAAGVLATTTLAQAATPITLPVRHLGRHLSEDVTLPVPPPPPVARPDVSRFPLNLKRLPRGCEADERRSAATRPPPWHATPAAIETPVRTPASSRWG